MGTYPLGKGTPPKGKAIRPNKPRQRPFGDKAGKIIYAQPAITGPASSQSILSSKMPPILRQSRPNLRIIHADKTRVVNEIYDPIQMERDLIGPVTKTLAISIAIINETKQAVDINLDDIQKNTLAMPNLVTRLGSMFLRYTYRIAKDWRDDIGATEIVLAINEDDRPMIFTPGQSRPLGDYKVNVHIPDQLLNYIVSGALRFSEHYQVQTSQEDVAGKYFKDTKSNYKKGVNVSKWATNTWDYQHALSSNLAKNLVIAFAGSKAVDIKGLSLFKPSVHGSTDKATMANSMRIADNITTRLKPIFRTNPAVISSNIQWLVRNARLGSQDLIIPYNRLTKFGKWAGTLGNALSVGVIIHQVKTDTWTASTLVDSASVMLSLTAALASGTTIAFLCITLAATYAFAELVSGGGISSYLNKRYIRNKPFAPPAFSFYADR